MRRLIWVSSAVLLALISMAGMASAADEPLLQFAPLAAAADSCCILKGDVNGNMRVNIQDIVYLINYIYRKGPMPPCTGNADVNCDCIITIKDVTCIMYALYGRGPFCQFCSCDHWYQTCVGN